MGGEWLKWKVVEVGGGIMRWDFVDLLLRKSTIKEQKKQR